MYIKRNVESLIDSYSKQFPVLILCGPRQVGKSTTLLLNKPKNMNYVTLDDMNARSLAISDPKFFLEQYGVPLLIDEIQYAPNLLSYIKIIVDEERISSLKNNKEQDCLFWLTGSQQFRLMKNISESLAGRASIINISSLSLSEINNNESSLFHPSIEMLENKKNYKKQTSKEIFKKIFLGGMPNIVTGVAERNLFFSSYVTTYIERDIKEIINIGKNREFYQFLQYIAARTAQEVNYASISKEVGVDAKTIKNWISILETSGIIYLLHPYSSNLSNRIIKAPKLYFMDTGLCSYLTNYLTPETLEVGALSGAIFETYVVSEIIKNFYNHGKDPRMNLYFYRDKDQKEIDLLFTEGNSIYPIEIKKGVSPNHPDKNFSVLNKFNQKVEKGLVICMNDKLEPLNRNCYLCPVSLI